MTRVLNVLSQMLAGWQRPRNRNVRDLPTALLRDFGLDPEAVSPRPTDYHPGSPEPFKSLN